MRLVLLLVLLLVAGPALSAQYPDGPNPASTDDGIAQVEELLLGLVAVTGFGLGVLGGSRR